MENEIFKILVVDDEPDILEFLSYNLKRAGYNVLVANEASKLVFQAGLLEAVLDLLSDFPKLDLAAAKYASDQLCQSDSVFFQHLGKHIVDQFPDGFVQSF